ncbi:MAG: hypothetical protein LBU48_01705, partial [Coriobacteriales bacterium]|nr:hypothetical protein [Coriobacteriales bacterium]
YTEFRARRATFVGERLVAGGGSTLRATLEFAGRLYADRYDSETTEEFTELTGIDVPFSLSPFSVAANWLEFDHFHQRHLAEYASYLEDDYRSYVDMLIALQSDGYTISPEEEELATLLAEWMSDNEDDEDDEEDEDDE